MSTHRHDAETTRGLWAGGIAAFGGVLLVMVGLFQVISGIAAVVEDDIFLLTPDYAYALDLTAWGWLHLALGTVGVVVGLCILFGQIWARATGILLAVLSAVSSFAFLPNAPVWSMLLIGIDVLVIWALSSLVVHG